MKKYKALFLDVDGTLSENNLICEKNRKAIYEALCQGIKITITTGRGSFMVLPMAHDLYLDAFGDSYSIALNGAHLIKNAPVSTPSIQPEDLGAALPDVPHNPMDDAIRDYTVLSRTSMSDEVSALLIEIANRHRIHFHAYADDIVYFMVPENPRFSKFTKYDCTLECMVLDEPDLEARMHYFTEIPEIYDLTAKAAKVYENYRIPEGIQKFILVSDDYEALLACAKEAECLKNDIRIEFSARHSLEFTPVSAGKGFGLAQVAKALGIPLSETVAMGDGENDISMLETAGLSIVPSNALPSVKEKADVVLDTGCSDGAVADAIYRYLLTP